MKREKSKLVAAMILFGTIGLFVRNMETPSSIIAFARGFIGVLFLTIIRCLGRNKVSWQAVKENFWWLALSGFCLGMNWILLFEAYRYTTVATATLCYYMAPILVTVVSPFLFQEKISTRKKLCTVVALIGMVLISGVVENGMPPLREAKGILFGLGAACLYAGIILVNKKMREITSYDKTILQLGVSALVLLPYCLLTEKAEVCAFTPYVVGMLLVVGILHTGITYYLYFGAIGYLPAQTVAIISYVDPAIAVLLSVMVLREGMSLLGMTGAVLLLGAALISEIT